MEQPESGMGYQMVKVTLNDESYTNTTVLNGRHLLAESDFPVDDIKSIDIIKKGLNNGTNN